LPEVCPSCLVRPPSGTLDLCAECDQLIRELPSPRCCMCGGVVDGPLDACGQCLEAGSKPWAHAVSVFQFADLARALVHRLKYQKRTYVAAFFGRRMAQNWKHYGTISPDVLVPVPLHWRKGIARGFNQSELIAAHIGKELGFPLRRAIRRQRWTRQQAVLDFSDRQANMTKAFVPRSNDRVEGLNVLLVDDVLTTGATLAAATQAVLDAGAESVSVITAARG